MAVHYVDAGAGWINGPPPLRRVPHLTVHTYLENEIMYPRVRALLPELEADALESYEEHHVADVLVIEKPKKAPTRPSQPSALKKTIDAEVV